MEVGRLKWDGMVAFWKDIEMRVRGWEERRDNGCVHGNVQLLYSLFIMVLIAKFIYKVSKSSRCLPFQLWPVPGSS